jgi:hypothetical protein
MPTLPNFFIAGAAKAGTTSLYHYLDQHPDIYMSPMKEPSFFSEEVRPENFEPAFREQATREEEESHRYIQGPMDHKRFSGIVRRWDDYIRLFAKAGSQSARGEGSVTYLWSPTAARAIASRIPDARIILILRDPADRAFSQYLHHVTGTLSRLSFRDHVEASLSHARSGLSIYHPFLERGLYAEQVQRYMDVFPRTQLGIWLYEDTHHYRQFFYEVLQFLGVDRSFALDDSTRHLQPQVPRLKSLSQPLRRSGIYSALKRLTPTALRPFARSLAFRKSNSVKISARDRSFLIDYYRDDISRLGPLINRDLSSWLH